MPTLSDATNDEIADEIARRINAAEAEAEKAGNRKRLRTLKAAHRRLDAARQMLIGGGDIQPFSGGGMKP